MRTIVHSWLTRVLFATVTTAGWLTGQAPPLKQQTASSNPTAVRDVIVGPNDTVTVIALNAEEISKPWQLNSAGDLNLPMVGRIHAAGMSAEELEEEIETRLKKYLRDPQVTVYVSQILSHPVTVSGGVMKPGIIQLDGPTSLFGALVEAGGPKDGVATVKITRSIENGAIPSPLAQASVDGKYSVAEIPLPSVMSGDGDNARLSVFPGDVITVPTEKRTRAVYIVGEVVKPGSIELVTQDTVNLTKALAMAGGFTRVAKPSKTMIRHVSENGSETALAFVDLGKIISGKAKDLLLSDGDILVIPSNQVLAYLQLTTQSAITTGVFMLGRL